MKKRFKRTTGRSDAGIFGHQTEDNPPGGRVCPTCGIRLDDKAASEFCPVCLLRMAFECGDDHQTKLSQNRDDLIQAEHSESSIPEAARREYDHFRIEVKEDGTLFELGRGAMGVTYKALDINLHRFVALKVISPRCVSDDSTRQRFVREARAAASLRHEHIASVYHLGSTGSNYFYSMEFVEGQTLEQILRSSGRLPKGLALEITSQAAAALAAAHQHQLVHRDIKPANLIISFDEKNRPTLKVIDFGLVKVSTEVSGDSSVSVPGIFMGTPHYASPEQFSGGQVDSRSDIYSLGITLWQMLTNATPFSGSPAQVAAQHLQAPLPLSELRHLPHPVVSLLTHLLEKDPKNRPQTPEELLTILNSTMKSVCAPQGARHEVRSQRSPTRTLKGRGRSYLAGSGDPNRRLEPWDFTPFLVEKFKGFIGREWLFQQIDEWRLKATSRALLIVGEPGVGKSSIVAALVHRNSDGQVLAYHCCRTDTPATLEPAGFVRSLASMFAARLDEYAAMLEGSSIVDSLLRSDTNPVSAFEAAILAPLHRIRQPEKGPCYLLIDALDEALTRTHSPTILDVLSTRFKSFPSWLRIVATTRNDRNVLSQLRSLRAQILSAQDPRNQDDVRRFIRCRLSEPIFRDKAKTSRKSLARLEEDLLESSAGNFLFVTTALDAVESGQLSFDHLEKLPPGLSSLYEIFFRRLFPNTAADFGSSRVVLETVAAAREPLNREQIAVATSLDPEEELPVILSRLASFVPTSEGRYALFHKSLFDWLTDWDDQDQPFAGAYHVNLQKGRARLADWCWSEYQRSSQNLSTYCLRHLPAHLHQVGRDNLLSTVLGEFHFLQAKLEATDASALIADYEYLPEAADLRLAQSAIQLSAHVLARDYRQLAGQLMGRLLGHAAPDIQALLMGAAESKSWPWLRPLTSSLAPPGGPLIRTFEGHTCWVHAVAVTPDGRCAISGSGDGTLRVWDLESNRPARILASHAGPVKAVAVTRNGRRVVSASADRTLRVWDLESGQSIYALEGHGGPVSAVAITPDGRCAVSASADWTLRVWDLGSGQCICTLEGHTDLVDAVTVTPDGYRAISASADHTLRVWDL